MSRVRAIHVEFTFVRNSKLEVNLKCHEVLSQKGGVCSVLAKLGWWKVEPPCAT